MVGGGGAGGFPQGLFFPNFRKTPPGASKIFCQFQIKRGGGGGGGGDTFLLGRARGRILLQPPNKKSTSHKLFQPQTQVARGTRKKKKGDPFNWPTGGGGKTGHKLWFRDLWKNKIRAPFFFNPPPRGWEKQKAGPLPAFSNFFFPADFFFFLWGTGSGGYFKTARGLQKGGLGCLPPGPPWKGTGFFCGSVVSAVFNHSFFPKKKGGWGGGGEGGGHRPATKFSTSAPGGGGELPGGGESLLRGGKQIG